MIAYGQSQLLTLVAARQIQQAQTREEAREGSPRRTHFRHPMAISRYVRRGSDGCQEGMFVISSFEPQQQSRCASSRPQGILSQGCKSIACRESRIAKKSASPRGRWQCTRRVRNTTAM
eukprot:6192553-Pleurochrysis_carterae.AAC.2